MTLSELIKKKNLRLEKIPEAFLSEVEKIQKKIFTEILNLVDGLERNGGLITASSGNLSSVLTIVDELKQALSGSEYRDVVEGFAKEFETQKLLNDDYFTKAFPEFSPVSLANDIVKKSQADAKAALLDSPLDANFLKPLENILSDSVATGASWKETLQSIQEFSIGNDDKDGKLLSYSKQIAHDNFAFSDRSYTNALSDDLESEWFFYSGGEIPGTRCFCKERHEQYFHYKEIEAWGRGENLKDCKSGDLWAGAVPATNEKTIFIYAGGFNCGHSIMPVSVFSVPKFVIERNLANGNYEPSEAELALLD